MTFDDFIEWAEEAILNWTQFEGLGRRARFDVMYDMETASITIRNSRGKLYDVDRRSLNIIFERYVNALPQAQHMTSYYTLPKWPEAPNMITAPYIAAVINYWNDNTQ